MTDRENLFAIVRVDLFLLEAGRLRANQDWKSLVTVKAVLDDQERAIAEVARLNTLNASKGCLYFWTTTRRDRGE